MDDQFGGRTDDDLFADEFEPVDDDLVEDPVVSQEPVPSTAAVLPNVTAAPAISQPSTAPAPTSSSAQNGATTVSSSHERPPEEPPKTLMQSRHAPQQPPASTPRAPRAHRPNHNGNNNTNNHSASNPTASNTPSGPTAPTAPKADVTERERRPHGAKQNPDSRLTSGANPRQKLTDEELAAKMAQMKLLNAEKTKQFERANADEQSHAIALEKATEQAKKRRADEAERRKREAVDRRQMDDERERNRERKLKAMGAKEGGWDEGKEERLVEEERRRGGFNFRGANGGIRGPAAPRGGGGGGGLSSSRFASPTDDTDFMSGRGGRGRGRAGGRGGRGGRGGFASPDEASHMPASKGPSSAPGAALRPEEFPALPTAPSTKTAAVAKTEIASPASPLGKWDDEMEAQDEKNAQAAVVSP